MKLILIIAFCLGVSFKGAAAESKPAVVPDPYEWSVRVYRFPADEIREGFVSRERGQLHAPPLPPTAANADDSVKFLKSSSDVVAQYLLLHGIPLLKGSLAVVDAENDILAVRTVNSTHDLIASLATGFLERVPHYLSFNVQIVESDANVIGQIVRDAHSNADHKALWERLQALAAQGKSRQISTLHLDTRSGQRASVTRGQLHRHADGFSADERDWLEVPTSSRRVGTLLEVDPVVGPDGRTLDLNFSLEHHFSPPVERWEPAAQSGLRRIESHVTDYHLVKLGSATTMISGMTKLLGVWKPEPVSDAARANAMQAAFLTGEIVPVLPLADTRIEQMLKAYGEKVEPTPPRAKTLPNEGLPSGMILRRFRVPPDFLSAGDAGSPLAAPADPFAAGGVVPRNEPRRMRSVTAIDILRSAGIPFPEGSSANFSTATGELIVRNLPENTEKVAAFVDSLLKKIPLVVEITTYVVQADGPLLRRLSAEASLVAEHAPVWRSIEEAVAQGKAKILRTAWIETRSGQRTGITTGTEYMRVGDASFENAFSDGKPGPSKAKVEDKRAAAVEAKPAAPQTPANPSVAHPVLRVEHEVQQVGFTIELDTVVGPDGHTVDLNFGLTYDYAPPSQRFEAAGAGEKVMRVESPATDFHKAELGSAITLNSGSTRLVGVWTPEGTQEFENADLLQAAFIRVDLTEATPVR